MGVRILTLEHLVPAVHGRVIETGMLQQRVPRFLIRCRLRSSAAFQRPVWGRKQPVATGRFGQSP